MLIEEIVEGYKMVWGRGSKGVVRRYRCTDGSKKGRVVAKPSTCGTATSLKKSGTLKKTRRSIGKKQATTRRNTMLRPTSKRLKKINRKTRSKNRSKFRK